MNDLLILTDDIAAAKQAVSQEFRLNELVRIVPLTANVPDDVTLIIRDGNLLMPPDWSGMLPPVLLPQPMPATPENLLTVLFMRLDNWEKAYQYAHTSRPTIWWRSAASLPGEATSGWP